MTEEELAHVLRAAADITGETDILVVGSQAVLGRLKERDLPERVTMSIEADLVFSGPDAEALADAVDGAIGEGSRFHQTYGYYAQGVDATTAILPGGWEQRVVPFRFGDVGNAAPVCLEIHDLVVSKLVAGREKDLEFGLAILEAGLVRSATLIGRAHGLPGPQSVSRRVVETIERLSRRATPPRS